jgi:nitrile hydratase accessory protein
LAPDAEPVFPEPWAAEAFAMTVLLYDKGLFSWTEWADALSVELRAQDPLKGGSDYFDCWVMALSTILADRRVADAATVSALQRSWQRAAEATPHGVPIELRNDPLRR